MTAPTAGVGSGIASGALLLADISGYTGFLDAVTTAHHDDLFGGDTVPAAYPLISTLLDGIIERLTPPFALAKLEGDAVFMSGALDTLPRGAELLDCLSACYRGLPGTVADRPRAVVLPVRRVRPGRHARPQVRAPCRELCHPFHGRWPRARRARVVVIAHRLLKNRAAEVLGTRAYALVTDRAMDRLGIPDGGSTALTEPLEGDRTWRRRPSGSPDRRPGWVPGSDRDGALVGRPLLRLVRAGACPVDPWADTRLLAEPPREIGWVLPPDLCSDRSHRIVGRRQQQRSAVRATLVGERARRLADPAPEGPGQVELAHAHLGSELGQVPSAAGGHAR